MAIITTVLGEKIEIGEDLDTFFDRMSNLSYPLIEFTEIYYCPHHPITSNCICRKPGSLMVEKAIAKYNVDVTKSFFIGDKERDITCANDAGVKGYLIESNEDFTTIINQEIKLNASIN